MSEIENLLPHRRPFLFVDKLIQADGEKIVAEYTFKEDDFFFKGHFPQYPVTPGVILIETMAQSGGAGLRSQGALGGDNLFFLASVDKVKFHRQVLPGDTLRSEIVNLRVSTKTIRQAGKGFVGDELACEAEWLCIVGAAN